jgi:hypothetical protein
MTITYHLDPDQRIVFTQISGTLTDEDIARFAVDVWGSLNGAVFDGLVDARAVARVTATPRGMQQNAEITTRLNPTLTPYRVAIVAPQDVVYGVGRMYEVYRERTPGIVQVFRTMEEALAWLRPAPEATRAVG